jgi:XTP/dITP diphosphohydrolase
MVIRTDVIYFNTLNDHKFSEIIELFQSKKSNYHLIQTRYKTIEIQAESIEEVAIYKLQSIKDNVDNSIFVEDAGFFIDEPLKGFPGVFSSYVMRTIGNEGILKLLTDVKQTKAHFTTVIALYFKPLEETFTFEGSVYGRISPEMRGNNGFGFDPIFIPEIRPDRTFAELPTNEKNKISHRARAWKKMIDFLKVS